MKKLIVALLIGLAWPATAQVTGSSPGVQGGGGVAPCSAFGKTSSTCATGSNSPFALEISLNDPAYGAVGDDTTDDTTALNSALTAIRTAISALPTPGSTVTGEVHVTCKAGSVFKITGPLNGTGINTYPQLVPVVFDLAGCAFDAQFTAGNAGKAIFDFMGDSYLTVNDANLWVSTLTNLPGTGMQFGRVTCSAPGTCTPAYHHKIVRPVVRGRYSVAGLYLRSSELTSITDPDVINSSTSTAAHGITFDGVDHFTIVTAATDQATADTAVPQNDDVVRGGHVSSAGGAPIWIGNIYRLTLDGTYTLSQNATTPTEGVRLYAGVGEIDLADFRIHSEPNLSVTTLPNTVVLEGGEGSGFAANDTLTLTGGTFTTAAVITVNTVGAAGQILTSTVTTGGAYTVNPSNPLAYTTSGSGVGAKFTGTFSAGALQSVALPTPTVKGLKLEDQFSYATSSLIGFNPGLPSATVLDLWVKTPNFNTGTAKVFTTTDASNLTLAGPFVWVPASGNWVRPATQYGGLICAGITSTQSCAFGSSVFTTNTGTGKAQVGDVGSGNFAGIILDGGTTSGHAAMYSAAGDQATYISRPTGNAIHFRENATAPDQMTIAAGGAVTVAGSFNGQGGVQVNGTNVIPTSQSILAAGSGSISQATNATYIQAEGWGGGGGGGDGISCGAGASCGGGAGGGGGGHFWTGPMSWSQLGVSSCTYVVGTGGVHGGGAAGTDTTLTCGSFVWHGFHGGAGQNGAAAAATGGGGGGGNVAAGGVGSGGTGGSLGQAGGSAGGSGIGGGASTSGQASGGGGSSNVGAGGAGGNAPMGTTGGGGGGGCNAGSAGNGANGGSNELGGSSGVGTNGKSPVVSSGTGAAGASGSTGAAGSPGTAGTPGGGGGGGGDGCNNTGTLSAGTNGADGRLIVTQK